MKPYQITSRVRYHPTFQSGGVRAGAVLAVVLCAFSLATPARAQYTGNNQTNIINNSAVDWTNNPSGYFIGLNWVYDALIIQNGGVLSNSWGYIGYASGADNNIAVVSGSGSVWSNQNYLWVGYSGSGNQLIITNGGAVYNNDCFVGGNSSSSNNTVLVNGSGSVWNNLNLVVGYNGSSNGLIVTNGGAVYSGDGYLGNSSNSNNIVLVSGAGSVWYGNNQIFIGDPGWGNQLIIANGGAVYNNANGNLGTGSGSSNNIVVVSGPGSIWHPAGGLYVGNGGAGNQLIITNGGQVLCANGYVSENAGDNSVLVTGSNSVWSMSGNLIFGDGSPGNNLTIEASGSVIATTVIVGNLANSTNNALNVSNGSLVVSNQAGTGALDVRQGILTLNGGSVTVDSIVITNSLGLLAFQSGVLGSKSTMYANGQGFNLGTGNGAATLELSDGAHVFSNGFTIAIASASTGAVWMTSGNMIIRGGSTTIGDVGIGQMTVSNGTVTIDPTYGFHVGENSGAQGTLTVAGGMVSGAGICAACGSSATGTVWVTGGQLSMGGIDIGSGGIGQMTVSNGTVATSSTYNFDVGVDPGSVGLLTVAGGSVLISNSLVLGYYGSAIGIVQVTGGQLYIYSLIIGLAGKGRLTITNGTMTANQLVLTSGANSVIEFSGGLLNSGGSFVTNGQTFVVGNGTNIATFNLLGGVHSFANNLEISDNASLTGCGTINGNVTIDPGGTVLANCGGTLTFTGIVTNNGTMRAINGSVLEGYGTVVNNGTIDITNGTTNFHGAFINNGTIIGGATTNCTPGVNWTEATPTAPWTARNASAALVFNGQMWVLGGNSNNVSLNDVWSSSDGRNWRQVTSAAPWSARDSFGAVVLNGKMWVFGGNGDGNLNDVWSSLDGTNWTEVSPAAPWTGRYAFAAVSFNGQMWVLGGYNVQSNSRFNDVWSSSDGTNWTQATAAAPWSARYAPAAVVFNGKMWVLGGAASGWLNDVWSSSDGTNWTQATSAASWSGREEFGALVFNGQMWVYGGRIDNNNDDLNDVWSSSDGTNWTEATPAAPWSARSAFEAVVFDGQMWVLGGYNGSSSFNDVWSSGCGSFISPFQITAIARQGNDIRVTWSCEGGQSYILQSTKSTAMIASYTTNFADISPVIVASGVSLSTTNYLDVGSAYAPVLTAPSGKNVTTSGVSSIVSISAEDTRGIEDSLGQALPIGSLLLLGTFSISEPTIQSNFIAGNVSTIMSNFTPYSTSFAVGDGTGLPASWSVSRSAAGFGGQQIYLLAINTPTFAAATHLGIFTAPSWVFPAGGGTNTIALENVTDFVIGAQGGSLTINLPLGGETYTFTDTARLSFLPGRILFYRVRLVP